MPIKAQEVFSPDRKIKLDFVIRNGGAHFKVWYNNKQLLEESPLGIVMMDENFERDLRLVSASKVTTVTHSYQMKNAKKSSMTYQASRRIFHLQNGHGKKMDIIFQLSNDGVAFRYYFPERSSDLKTIMREATAYHFNPATRTWLQPMSVAKSGWEKK